MKTYLNSLYLPDDKLESAYMADRIDPQHKIKLNGVYTTYYPFGLFTRFSDPLRIEFSPITILYGSNGSGKSTLLNVIAELLALDRNSPYSKTAFFEDYCGLCCTDHSDIPRGSKIITSDDIFRYLSDTHGINRYIDTKRDEVWESKKRIQDEVIEDHSLLYLRGLDDMERWKEYHAAV